MSDPGSEKLHFPNKATREKCWNSRDEYWKCLDDNKEDESKCKQFRQMFESVCPNLWITHYRRVRKLNKFKEKMETEDFDPIDYYSKQQKEDDSKE